jgi:hypothetical protein
MAKSLIDNLRLLRLARTTQIIRAPGIADISAMLAVQAGLIASLTLLTLIVGIAVFDKVFGASWELHHPAKTIPSHGQTRMVLNYTIALPVTVVVQTF